MRKHELKDGIEVLDSSGKVVGTSQVAAKCVSDLSYTNSDDTVEPLLLAPKKALIGLQGNFTLHLQLAQAEVLYKT